MTTIEAIYQGGVFKPLGEVKLLENQRVKITVEPEAPAMTPKTPEWLARAQAHQREFVAEFRGLSGTAIQRKILAEVGCSYQSLAGFFGVEQVNHSGLVRLLAAMQKHSKPVAPKLLGIIGREVWHIVQARRRGRAAARLHVQIVALFSIIAAVPAILVSLVATVTLDRGLDRLFSTRLQSVVGHSLSVAKAYVGEHAGMIRGDIMAMAFDVARAKPLYDQDRERFRQFFTAQAAVRALPAALIIDNQLQVVERADPRVNQTFVMPSKETLATITDQ